MLATFFFLFLLPALAAAQYGGYGAPAGPTTTAAAAVTVPSAPPDTPGQMNIDVAFQGTFTFNPANITAPVGTLVTFYFPNAGLQHSVTQSAFESPCVHLAATSDSPAGFDSGLTEASIFTIDITDTQPIWFHCKMATHCPSGMVGSINAPSTGNTFDAFMTAARDSTSPTEPDNGPVLGGVHGVATGGPTSSTGISTGGSTSGAVRVAECTGAALLSIVLAILLA
ncbi:hypothetical protein NLJ89_g1679 [Agrocybe chaxingu]|uniref:Blue (type 1) copper domain-containing protein n=1 Tax=Agrocybe chaxingu TaxID=84603 RepID=A0A9W8TEU2_9AGAR|nr:hypothetical protein NLJ89_g1679 [Agrocybe chaxingu]